MALLSDWEALTPRLQALIQQENLPDDFLETVTLHFIPLAENIAAQQQSLDRPLIVGINGAQGTGKSTLALFLQTLLHNGLGLPSARFSLDDIYLTKTERQQLAESVHPLFLTRGVPGTHDLTLGQNTLDALCSSTDPVPIPVFDKAIDDRAPQESWPCFQGPAKIILVEGWCVGALAEQAQAILTEPLNELERIEDEDGLWRSYINQRLKGEYAEFFGQIDCLVMLKAPSMECIMEWRTLQEVKLAEKLYVHQAGADEAPVTGVALLELPKTEQTKGIMAPQQLKRFIMHYERLTRAMLEEMPGRADILFLINDQHQIVSTRYYEQ